MGWKYREMFSCPLALILGRFNYGVHQGAVILNVLNYRSTVLLTDDRGYRLVSNIPPSLDHGETGSLCIRIAKREINYLSLHEKMLYRSYLYGGIGAFLLRRGEVIPISIDLVNPTSFSIFLDPRRDFSSANTASLEHWLMFQVALREGDHSLLKETCRALGELLGDGCAINSDKGLLYIRSPGTSAENLLRILPDNAPLRHVIKL